VSPGGSRKLCAERPSSRKFRVWTAGRWRPVYVWTWSTRAPEAIQLGNLIALAFDRAAEVTSDSQRAAELATFTVTQWLRRTGQLHLLRQLAAEVDEIAQSPRLPHRKEGPTSQGRGASRRGSASLAA
jgi:hypothetical protein